MAVNFISGTPRSGSTLLAALLRQNPRFHTAVASPVYGMCMSLVQHMGASTEFSVFFSDERRRKILTSLFDAYHAVGPNEVAFDSSRLWSGKLALIESLFPAARVICCVRDPRWILDSAEHIYRRNPLQSSALFEHNPNTSVGVRLASMMEANKGFVGGAWSALREGWFSEQAKKLILLRYKSLVSAPAQAMERLYQGLGEAPFAHDFTNFAYAEPEYDARLGMPGLHAVHGPLRQETRATILPPEQFEKYGGLEFWLKADGNPRGVEVI